MSNEYVDSRYPLSALTSNIIAAAREVHRFLGPGFEEVIYQRALAKEFPAHGLEYDRQVWIDVSQGIGIQDRVVAQLWWKATGDQAVGELARLESLKH